MNIRTPNYLTQFHCLCGQCPDTCCGSWQVIPDPDTLARYRKVPGEFGQRLRASLYLEDGEVMFRTDHNHLCPMLTKGGLCSVQLELGEEGLCKVCRAYPRWQKTYGSLEVKGLCLSCPETARILLNQVEPITFLTESNDQPVTEYNTLDADFYFFLAELRKTAISLVQDRRMNWKMRSAVLLELGRQVQSCLLFRKMEQAKAVLSGFTSGALLPAAKEKVRSRSGNQMQLLRDVRQMAQFFGKLEILTPQWQTLVDRLSKACVGTGHRYAYDDQLLAHFAKDYREKQHLFEHVLVYFLDRYLLMACYDKDVLGKIKLAVVSAFFLEQLDLLLYADNQLRLTDDMQIDALHRYCRELEHCEENMRDLGKALRRSRIFDTNRLIRDLMKR